MAGLSYGPQVVLNLLGRLAGFFLRRMI